ncbi:MAG: hypothetical protein GC205_12430 [Bacteroidetes bacterium]|nr:hypothetical protein [Bacteroidota bacterium]
MLVLLAEANSVAQPILYGTNNYIEYHVGTLPFVISVPHGGSLNPAGIPNRTCNDPVYATDANTVEMGLALRNFLYEKTGCYPHLIICQLRRSKLDANRNLEDAACGNAEAEQAWSEFHSFIDTAQTLAEAGFPDHVLYLDLHGHGNPIARTELGYLLYDTELELSDVALNEEPYLSYSSIRGLVLRNTNNLTHAELLRGDFALGTMMAGSGYDAVPSAQDPSPGIGSNYYSGGYNTATHTCYTPGNLANGLQMECPFAGVRDTESNRARFADTLAVVLLRYWSLHKALDLTACSTASGFEEGHAPGHGPHTTRGADFLLYPNPLPLGERTLRLNTAVPEGTSFQVFDTGGRAVAAGHIRQGELLLPLALPAGPYATLLVNAKGFRGRASFVVE